MWPITRAAVRAISLTGGTVSVAAINALGTTATTARFAGGSGGSVLLDATSGGITLTQHQHHGGQWQRCRRRRKRWEHHHPGCGDPHHQRDPLGGRRHGRHHRGGRQHPAAGYRRWELCRNPLATLTAGTGDVTIGGATGNINSLSALTITGNDISLGNIGGASAGVTGATSATATTNGADIGSIVFTGTTYNANAQTYTSPAGNTFLLNAGATTTFTTSADAVTFTTGTLLMADGSNLSVNTAGGAISALGGIRGTSLESVTLNAGAYDVERRRDWLGQ